MSKIFIKIHTVPIWPVGLLLGEDDIIMQKLARYYEVYNKTIENIIGQHICPKIILKGFSVKENLCLTGIIL
jgi:vancomycin permeability regulator SanA